MVLPKKNPKNRHKRRGHDKERKIVRAFKNLKKTNIGFRSAGSHSPIDCCMIDPLERKIILAQSKHTLALKGGISPAEKRKLEEQYKFLNGTYNVEFQAL